MRSLCALSLLALSACVPTQTARPLASPVTQPGSQEGAAEGFLTHGLEPLVQSLAGEGYRALAGVERGFLAPQARAVQPITLAPRRCLVVLAVATASILDLDAAIYAPDGSVLAEDDTTGARPVVRLCSGERALSGYLALYAFQGTGSYAAMRLERPLAPADALALAASAEEPDGADGTPAFSELLRGLHSRGYADEGPITEVPLTEGSVRLTSRVLAGRCYSVVADGKQLRVRLLDDAGHEVAVGVGATGPAALQYCAREDADLLLELSTQGEQRSARLARLVVGQAAAGSARAIFLGEPAPAAAAPAHNGKESSERVCKGGVIELFRRGALAQGGLIERELKLPGCAELQAELHEGLSVVTVRVETAAGELLAERELQRPSGALRVCARGGELRVTVIARAGFGALSLRSQACGDSP